MGRSTELGTSYLCIESKVYPSLNMWMTAKMVEEIDEMIWENRHHFLTKCTWHALNVNASRTKVLLMNTEKCSSHESPPEQLKSYQVGENRTRTRSLGLMTWKVLRRNAWNDVANCRIKRFSNCTRSLHHVLPTITSKKEELEAVGELSNVSSQNFPKCLYFAQIG